MPSFRTFITLIRQGCSSGFHPTRHWVLKGIHAMVQRIPSRQQTVLSNCDNHRTIRLQALVTGKSKMHRCFKNVRKLWGRKKSAPNRKACVDKKNQLDVTFVFYISLLLVAQHVSGNHVPIIRSWRLRDVIVSCWYVPWLREGCQDRLAGSVSMDGFVSQLAVSWRVGRAAPPSS
jgi:hypothetical protein